jgi:hypothetical protein
MRAYSPTLRKYCTVVSTKQLKEVQESGDSKATITVETHVNIYGLKETPFFRKLDVAEVKYSELKF